MALSLLIMTGALGAVIVRRHVLITEDVLTGGNPKYQKMKLLPGSITWEIACGPKVKWKNALSVSREHVKGGCQLVWKPVLPVPVFLATYSILTVKYAMS